MTLTIRPGHSTLSVPVRAEIPNAPAPRDLTVPTTQKRKRAVTRVRDGSMARTVTQDAETGLVEARVFFDGGVFGPVGDLRLDDTGTVMGDISDRRYTIHPDDPLSASATMTQNAKFERGDWRAYIDTTSRMTATADAFHFEATVVCRDGETEFHRVDWTHEIPRKGM